MTFAHRVAVALERGDWKGPLARGCAAAWEPLADGWLVRRLALPAGRRVVTVGGATLGGSGKTPVAIACASELAANGARVALVGHAYRGKPGRARVVGPDDALAEVGDEALLAARALAGTGASVVVAPRRSEAVAWAGQHAQVLVLDGVAQTSPVRASLSLLAVDAREPWGSGAVPPLGDLRASLPALRRACDAVVAVDEDVKEGQPGPSAEGFPPSAVSSARSISNGVKVGDALYTWDDIAGKRVGLLCALARADRVVRWLERRGIVCARVERARDHGPFDRAFLERTARAEATARLDLWLITPKCGLHLASGPDVTDFVRAPVGVIDHRLVLCDAMRARLRLVALP